MIKRLFVTSIMFMLLSSSLLVGFHHVDVAASEENVSQQHNLDGYVSEWNYTSDPDLINWISYDVAVDSKDNIITVGRETRGESYNATTMWRVAKSNSSGSVLWAKTFDLNTGNYSVDYAEGVAVANNDDIVVVGWDNDTASGRHQWRIMRLNAAGDTLWSNTVDPNINANDMAYSAAIDKDNNIIVVGGDVNTTSSRYQWRIMKYNATGELLWWKTADYSTDSNDEANDVALDSNSNILVAGYDNVEGNYRWRIMKFDAEGTLIWEYTLNPSTGADRAWSVATDKDDNVVVAGYDDLPGDNQWRIVKLTSTGSLSWEFTPNPSSGSGRVQSVAVDSRNCIIAAGYDSNTTNGDYQWRIMKLDPQGKLLAEYATNPSIETEGGLGGTDMAFGVACDSSDCIIVTGYESVTGNPSANKIMRIMKFSPTKLSLWEEWWFWAAIAVVAVVFASGGYLLTKKKRPQ
jgi:uncharacterized delta-60 repeat protein